MLNAEGNADYRYKIQYRRYHMPNGKPQSTQNKPYDVSDETWATGADISLAGEIFPADRLLPKGEEGEGANNEASLTPWDSDY
jgi:hypothetical protein